MMRFSVLEVMGQPLYTVYHGNRFYCDERTDVV